MYYQNPDLERAFSFIANLDFDVLCLQEVPERFLERLKKLPYNMAHSLDIQRFERGETIRNYCVILTRHTVLSTKPLMFPDLRRPLRTKLLQFALWRLRRIEKRGSLCADIALPAGTFRVFCLHLTLSYPERLMREFDLAMKQPDPETPTIVCGDLNIVESPCISVLNWLEGGRVRDIFAWRSERREMEKKFAELDLQNPLRGTHTQTIARSQLDHILVPKNLRIVQAKVLPDRYGSDHNPVFVEAE